MRFIFVFFSLILWVLPCSAQNIGELDQKYGFRDIALGSPKDSLRILGETPVTANHTQQVKLDHSQIMINGLPLQSLVCELFKDKVVQIRIYAAQEIKPGQTVTKYYDFLESSFGKPTLRESDAKTNSTLSEWDGNKVRLAAFEHIEKNPNGSLQYQIQIRFISLALTREMKESPEK